MPRCLTCRKTFDEERPIGARCPTCRTPFYEPPPVLERAPGDADATCATHAGNLSLGPCSRCGSFMCSVCRTRWRSSWLCAECVARHLDAGEAAPEEVRAGVLQSVVAVILGIAGWVLVVGAFVIIGLAVAANGNLALAMLGVILMVGSGAPALIALGQGAAALHTRGNHMILATAGIVLGGLLIGALIGLFSFSIWVN